MNSDLQTIAALVIVGLTVVALAIGRRRRRNRGCPAGCACPTTKPRR
jgi:hypothetical protein